MKFEEKFKQITVSSDLVRLITGCEEAEAYAFKAFDGWEQAIEEYLNPVWTANCWYPSDKLENGAIYLLLVDESGFAYPVDISYAQKNIHLGFQNAIYDMYDVLGELHDGTN